MKVILRTEVPKLGARGEVVEVRGGYARNFLLPRGLAYEATPENQRRIAKERRQAEQLAAAEAAEARNLAGRLTGISATVQVKADGETIYGSVGATDIVAAIASEHGLNVDSSAVRLEEPIKKIGTHDVVLHLAAGADAPIKVWVLPEDGDLRQEPAGAEADGETGPVAPAEGAGEQPGDLGEASPGEA
jgi:large subunit ribosomal protein L9